MKSHYKRGNLFKKLYILYSLFAVAGCVNNPVESKVSTELLKNRGFELGTASWEWRGYGQNNYSYGLASEQSHSGSNSIFIELDTIADISEYTLFAQRISTVDSTWLEGKSLSLVAWVKTENISGPGICIVLRGDAPVVGQPPVLYVSTQSATPITGTKEWTRYEVNTTITRSDIFYMQVYLIYQNDTTGKVYFDDVSLTVHEH